MSRQGDKAAEGNVCTVCAWIQDLLNTFRKIVNRWELLQNARGGLVMRRDLKGDFNMRKADVLMADPTVFMVVAAHGVGLIAAEKSKGDAKIKPCSSRSVDV